VANCVKQSNGPGGRRGSRLRAELAGKNRRLPLLGNSNGTADRSYIKELIVARNRELRGKYGV